MMRGLRRGAPGDAADGRRPGRWQALDLARGLAVLAMIAFHFAWDMSYLRLVSFDMIGSPFGRVSARLIAGSFLLLSGIGLVLAHRRGFDARAFLRRLAVVGGAAGGVTLATWFAFPDSYIFFGVLHCIALSSVLALPALRVPLWLVGATAFLCLVAPLTLTGSAFDAPALAFLGLGTRVPVTNDYVPVFPWFGVVLVGVALARVGLPAAMRAGLPGWRSPKAGLRALAWGGRHSLTIYLAHQPLLFGALFLLAQTVEPGPEADGAPFHAACQASCHDAGRGPDLCRSACACMAEGLKADGLWNDAVADRLTPADRARISPLAQVCFKAAGPAPPTDAAQPQAGETRP